MICEFCGYPLDVISKRGRPPVYHEQCGKIHHSLSWVMSQLEGVQLTAAASGRLRRRVFIMVNGPCRVPVARDSRGRFLRRRVSL